MCVRASLAIGIGCGPNSHAGEHLGAAGAALMAAAFRHVNKPGTRGCGVRLLRMNSEGAARWRVAQH